MFGKPKRIVKRILIVEDEPLTAFDNETMIEEAGYTVVATHDRVSDAVLTLERGSVDLILSDVRLTGKRSGIDLARLFGGTDAKTYAYGYRAMFPHTGDQFTQPFGNRFTLACHTGHRNEIDKSLRIAGDFLHALAGCGWREHLNQW